MPPKTCTNCGTALLGAYCHVCGQEAVELRVPLRRLVGEALGDLLAFDSRILRTLSPLLARPGLLSGEWAAGRRVAYVPPLRLYLFVAALFFLLMAVTDVALVEVSEPAGGGGVTFSAGDRPVARAETPNVLDSFGDRLAAAAHADPQRFQDDVVDRLGRLALLTAPLSALLLALLYRSRRRYLVEHLVFALHVHAFVFLLLSVLLLLPRDGGFFPLAVRLAVGAILLYLVVALRRFYGGRWWPALARTAVFAFLYVLVLLVPLLTVALFWAVYTA